MAIRLLIIEDSDDDALLIIRQFRRANIDLVSERVDTASGVATALEHGAPDVIICDYNMPAFSADEALEQVRATGMDVPFILVSGEVGEETAAALMKAGAHDFLLKDRLARLVPAVERELREAADRRQRRGAEAALRDSEERFRLLAEHAQDIVFRYRWLPEPAVEYISPAVAKIIGYSPEQLYADPDLLFSLVEPEDRAHLEASWLSPEPGPLTVRWRRRDGALVWIEQRAAAVRDGTGSVLAVEGILRDTTDRVVADQERQQLEHQLRQNERLDSLGHLAGGIAHDFNNLLAVVSGYCAMLMESLPPGDANLGDVEGISKAAERGAALIRELLIFSRLEPSRPETVNLNTIVADTENLLHRTLGEDIEFVVDLDPALRSVTIDRSKIEQVLINLIVNARGAMPSGGTLTVRTQNLDMILRRPGLTPLGPELVCLSVTDAGCGMAADVVQRAFEPFFTTKPPGQGTGLGLATAYGAVTGAGGHIELESEPGRGTTVRVHLPATAEQLSIPQRPDTNPPAGNGEVVLLVEDEDGVREVVRRILTRSGYQVHERSSPVDALRLVDASENRLDILLTDVVMPGMSGTQLAARTRQIRPTLPVLFMSGYTTGPAPGGQELPRDSVLLHKPFDRPTLLRVLHQVLQAGVG
ncbi:MAG TPA: response regulator [Catenuloplanes sp.]|jgi:hypothetical protein